MHEEYILYHSTPLRKYPNIRLRGLTTGHRRNYWQSQPVYLYFTTTPREALLWGIESIRHKMFKHPLQRKWEWAEFAGDDNEWGIDFNTRTKKAKKEWGIVYDNFIRPVLLESLNELVTDGLAILEVEIPASLLRQRRFEYRLPVDVIGSGVDPERISVYDAIERNDFYDIVYDFCKSGKDPRMRTIPPPKSFNTDRPWEWV